MSEITASPVPADRIGLGIASAVAGMLFLSMMDTCAKLLGAGYAVSQVILFRNLLGVLAILAFLLVTRAGLGPLYPRRPALLLLRTALNLTMGFLFFTSLRHLPLAEAFAITFVAPMFITALSVPVLGEQVGMRRWSAVLVGLVGVVIVIQPGTASFQPAALLPAAAALCYAAAMLIGRKMSRDMSTSAILLWPSVGAVLVTGLMMPSQWQTPPAADLGLFLFMGLIGTLGMALITQGYRYAPAAVVAPFDYSVLLWGALFGWVIFKELPGPNVWIGASILVASGLYILHRETR
jgi:drug/metabolite transporter (DMT)-like permease